MEVVERWLEVARLDALLIEEDALVVGLVEVPADFIVSACVGGLGIGHEVECAQEDLRSYREYFAGVGQPCLRGSSLNLDLAQFLSDLDLWKLIVSEQVEESVLFHLQFLELAADGRVEFGDAALFLAQCFIEELANVVDIVCRQVQRRVVIHDCLFHFVCS